MNKPNPLVPQGTFADKGRSHVRITVFAILAVHLVLLGVLLIAGCNKGTDPGAGDPNAGLPPVPPPTPADLPPAATPTNPPDTGLVGTPPVPHTPPSNAVVEPPQPVTPPTPIMPPPPPPPAAPEFTEHTIVAGESFYTLGKKYGVGFKAIAAANPGVDSTRLKVGQKVKIPAAKAATTAGTPAPAPGAPADATAPSPSGEVTHVVKSGDNLWTLSRKYGVKESAIRAANNLRTSQLKVGQKLKIPSKTPPLTPSTPGTPSTPPVTDPGLGLPPATPSGGAPALTPIP